MRRPVTMADVAAQAGVHESTVSHVVNGTRPVSDAVRARVVQAISETGYSPNTVARSLATSYTHLIGIVMSALTNRFFIPVVAAIDIAGRRHGYSSVLADSRDRVDDEADAVDMLLSRRVDGIVLTPTAGDREAVLDRLAAGGVPTVLVDRFADDRFDQVGPENTEATAYLVQHLATLGHDRIAFLSGRKGLSTTSERATGYRLGLERAGLGFEQDLVRSGRSAAATAERSVNALLGRKNPPTAIVSGDREMTIGVLRALKNSGMRVPDDIALVAYDDLDFGDVLEPSLTVMAQPVSEIASTAVDLLIRRITGKARTMDPQRVQIATAFIHRESCGCGLAGSTDTMVGASRRRAGRPLEASRL